MAVGLQLVRECGTKKCTTYQYCSDSVCRSCQTICLNTSHNFDYHVCESSCQDYIHDKIKHYIIGLEDIQGTTEKLRNLVAASLIISALVALLFVSLLGFAWLRYRGKRRNKRNGNMDLMDQKINTVSGLVNNNSTKDKPLRLDMPPSSTGNSSTAAPSVITATTPVSTRHPIEIETLEYAAYINQGMTPSPVLAQPNGGIILAPTDNNAILTPTGVGNPIGVGPITSSTMITGITTSGSGGGGETTF